jgi:hypothetical protein
VQPSNWEIDRGLQFIHRAIDGIGQMAHRIAIHVDGCEKSLVEKAQNDEGHEHRIVEAGNQVMGPEPAEPGFYSDMTRRSAESAHEQQAHGDEQQGADADARQQGRQRLALPKVDAQGVDGREEAEDNPAFRQQARHAHQVTGPLSC